MDNASSLITDVHALLALGSYGRARRLAVLAQEELQRVPVLQTEVNIVDYDRLRHRRLHGDAPGLVELAIGNADDALEVATTGPSTRQTHRDSEGRRP